MSDERATHHLGPPHLGLPLARLRMRKSDFERAYAGGRRAQGACFALVVCENGGELTRMGLSVSKRRARLAVDRNRLRRIFREAFRMNLPELPPGLDIVMIATSRGPAPSLEKACAELPALVRKALLKRPRRTPKSPG